MKLKKTASLAIAVGAICISTFPFSVAAKEVSQDSAAFPFNIENVLQENSIESRSASITHHGVLDGMTRERTLPKNFCDLAMGPYTATMKRIGPNNLYTNFYFLPDENNELFVSFTINASSASSFYVGVYDMVTGSTKEQYFSIDSQISDAARFSYLKPGRGYAVYFRADGSTMNGVAEVYYPSTKN